MSAVEPKPYLREILFDRAKVTSPNEYPFNLAVFRHLEILRFHRDVTFFVGENGSGKSTLLEAIAVGLNFNPEGGTLNTRFATKETHSPLHQTLKLVRSFKKPKDGFFLRAESFYNLASYVDDVGAVGGYGGESLHRQSHGEAFLSTMMNRLRGNGIYLFDEPEAALSPSRQLSTLAVIDQLVKKDSQFIIATHSPILLSYPRALIYQFGEDGINTVAYEETEHYRVTKDFLNRHAQMLKELLDD